MPRIVVLDGFTLNPGDLDWQPIADLGNLTIHDRTPPDLVLERARHADIILTNKTPSSPATLSTSSIPDAPRHQQPNFPIAPPASPLYSAPE